MTSARLVTALDVAPDHPAFEGHFPGRPIVPAVVLLAEALAAIEAAGLRPAHGWKVTSAKFLAPVAPGTPLTLAHEPAGAGRRFEVRAAQTLVAAGTLSPA